MTDEHTLLLGEIKGKLDSLTDTVTSMDGKVDKIDGRLQKVERSAAMHGAIGGGIAGVGLTLLAEKFKRSMGM